MHSFFENMLQAPSVKRFIAGASRLMARGSEVTAQARTLASRARSGDWSWLVPNMSTSGWWSAGGQPDQQLEALVVTAEAAASAVEPAAPPAPAPWSVPSEDNTVGDRAGFMGVTDTGSVFMDFGRRPGVKAPTPNLGTNGVMVVYEALTEAQQSTVGALVGDASEASRQKGLSQPGDFDGFLNTVLQVCTQDPGVRLEVNSVTRTLRLVGKAPKPQLVS